MIDDTARFSGIIQKRIPSETNELICSAAPSTRSLRQNSERSGVVICYDVCFPETVRLLTLAGAELVLVPAAWRASYYFKEWWDLNLACRALDNLVYIAAVNRCGLSGDEIFAGKSQLVSPIGERIDSCGVQEEAILYGSVDLNRIAKERDFNTVLTDRHPGGLSSYLGYTLQGGIIND